jgi:hypothetical protein
MEFTTPREKHVYENAVAFTAVRGRGVHRIRTECGTLEEAFNRAAEFGDGRTMIYAIDALGGNAHICNK